MLVVVASSFDQEARDFASDHSARLLTCRDLSLPGWRHHLQAPGLSRAVISGVELPACEISGVLNRLPAATETELFHIAPEDRSFVASEMTAFLMSWITSLPCPLLNRPTPNCLVGANWRVEEWLVNAHRAGIRTQPITLGSHQEHILSENLSKPSATVTVVGLRCIGDVDHRLYDYSRRLAYRAGVDFLSVYFTGAESDAAFAGVSLTPDLMIPQVADAVLEYFSGAGAC